jgi:hypothetical protein
MTALSRGNSRLRAFLCRFAGMVHFFAPPARTRKPVKDLRDIPDSLKRDIGLLDTLERGRGRHPAKHGDTWQSASERDRNWQRHLDRPVFPPV